MQDGVVTEVFIRFTEQHGGQIQAVRRGRRRKFLAGDFRQSGVAVHQADHLIADPRLDLPSPAHNERNATASFENEILRAAQTACRLMAIQVLHRAIIVAIKKNRSVVAREDDDGVFGQIKTVERLHDLANLPVNLMDHIASHAALACANKRRLGHARHMRLEKADTEKKRLVLWRSMYSTDFATTLVASSSSLNLAA